MHGHSTQLPSKNPGGLPLVDFGELQARYQAMPLARRAEAVLKDAEPALLVAEQMLSLLSTQPKIKHTFEHIRANQVLIAKLRACEAKNMLLDNADFIDITRKKLAAWRKTMERIAAGEGLITEGNREYISSQVPLAGALASVTAISAYLSIVQLAIGELIKTDSKNATQHNSVLAKTRRCATLLSDCEIAASFGAVVH